MRKTILVGWTALAALAFAGGCTNKQGTTEAPVFITVNIEQQPGFVNVAVPAAVQILSLIHI